MFTVLLPPGVNPIAVSKIYHTSYYQPVHLTYCVVWQGTNFELPEDDTIVSKHIRTV